MPFRFPFLLALLVLAFAGLAWSGTAPGATMPQEIRALLDAMPDNSASADVRRFYTMRNDAPAWDDPSARSTLAAVLAGAVDAGLPASFAAPDEKAMGQGAVRDVAVTRIALAYATALARGRVEPDKIETDWGIPAPAFDAAAGLSGALRHDLAAWYATLPPKHPAYQRLVEALARYRAMHAWSPIPRGAPLKLGMTDQRVIALRRRLEVEGDLAGAPPSIPTVSVEDSGSIRRVAVSTDPGVANPQTNPAATPIRDADAVFDDGVAAAVRRFQRRYGIAVDGAVGPRTLAAMNVPLRTRIGQIELNLERWRTLPHDLGGSYMLVNVPAESLEVVQSGIPVIAMKVVVGDLDHPTPVVRTAIAALTFNPTWNIPSSIASKEIEPKAKQDRSYLRKNEIVFTPGRGWQQLPGPKNPLGQLKFETPNQFDVYLHDTPSRLAFDRFFRAQSHGCVRLENAAELAAFVLSDLGWNELQIAQAAASGESRRIDIKHHWRVWLLYATSFVDDDGIVEFRDDLYGRDARLKAALAGERATETPAGL